MAVYDIHPREMLGFLQGYLSPRHLRPVLEAEPRLVSFLGDFEGLAARLEAELELGGPDAERASLRARRDALVQRHDARVRQIWHILQAALSAEDPELVRRAERADRLLLPVGRGFVQRGHFARFAEAQGHERFDADAQDLLRSLRGPGGEDLLDLHEARLAAANALGQVLDRLRRHDARERPKPSMRALRAEWSRTLRLFAAIIDHMGLAPEARAALLGHVEAASARVRRKGERGVERDAPGRGPRIPTQEVRISGLNPMIAMITLLIVRNLPDELVKELKLRAAENMRSAEEEHREILKSVLTKPRRSLKSLLAGMPDIGDDGDFEREQDLGRTVDL